MKPLTEREAIRLAFRLAMMAAESSRISREALRMSSDDEQKGLDAVIAYFTPLGLTLKIEEVKL